MFSFIFYAWQKICPTPCILSYLLPNSTLTSLAGRCKLTRIVALAMLALSVLSCTAAPTGGQVQTSTEPPLAKRVNVAPGACLQEQEELLVDAARGAKFLAWHASEYADALKRAAPTKRTAHEYIKFWFGVDIRWRGLSSPMSVSAEHVFDNVFWELGHVPWDEDIEKTVEREGNWSSKVAEADIPVAFTTSTNQRQGNIQIICDQPSSPTTDSTEACGSPDATPPIYGYYDRSQTNQLTLCKSFWDLPSDVDNWYDYDRASALLSLLIRGPRISPFYLLDPGKLPEFADRVRGPDIFKICPPYNKMFNVDNWVSFARAVTSHTFSVGRALDQFEAECVETEEDRLMEEEVSEIVAEMVKSVVQDV